ncbi:amidase [Sphaerisporangium siamense]|uniref:Aspartyl-tRNA(Asn)/glutamyl-tRNA(Gln) amidotransferase subunit A n=1 Tax=Sphaerisporangium siamense TaxID=795645 RepID=A0A7W7G9X4_9ACTN|nr:amidase [Sphaerisporangium siamense]MBB4699401.1 aspartyl-tRNA(Asn)/glutamyl-tRNA(Gln) amidotransferase subunit A [Sphaerisporangium siamense]GII89594.1 amidase [Sphaerisporangium siamense]
MRQDEVVRASAGDLVAAYRGGRVSPVEVTRAVLERIRRDNPELRAYCLVDEDGALVQAEASHRRWRRGQALGPLDGVPTSIKDLFLTAGWPTRRGSRRVDADQPWTVDSPVAARLREAGAVLLGKTTTPEFGWKAVTDNPIDGVTRNPIDPSLTAGGSSGGSGAALAAGMGALSVATDAAGSTRIPAAFCGVVGLKPTYGRIPLYPGSDLGWLGCAGPMARTVGDVAALLDVLAAPDDRDPNAMPAPTGSYRAGMRRPVRGLRAAYSPTLGYARVDPEVAKVVEAAVAALDDAGVVVQAVDPPFSDPLDVFTVLWSTGMAPLLHSQLGGSPDGIDQGLAELIEQGSRYSVTDYLAARRAALGIGTAMGAFHRDYDVLLTPTVPIEPFAAGHDVPPGSDARSWLEWTPFTLPFSLSQQPALSVPAGMTSRGLPVGLQIVAARHAEDLVLAVGAAVEEALGSTVGPTR